ncbi:MAG: DUF6709 family protein [Wujia sp.]
MAKQKKQKSSNGIGGSIFGLILFLVLGIVLIISESKYLFSAPVDFNKEIADSGTPEKGTYVTVGVDAVVDWYAETEYKINGIIPAGKEQHCLLWLDDGSFVSMTVKGKNIDKVNKLIQETTYYLSGVSDDLPTKVVFEGKVTSIGSEVSQYYNEVLDAYEISAADGLVIRYVTIDTTESKMRTWLMFGFCMLMAAVFVVTLVISVKNKKKAKQQQAAMATQAAYSGSMQTGVDPYGNPIQPGVDPYGNPIQPGTDPYGNVNNPGMSGQSMPYDDNNNNLYS